MQSIESKIIPVTRPTLVGLEEIQDALREIWASGTLTFGPYLNRFEEAVARKLGVRHAVALSTCTSGLILAIKALELHGEIILPSFTFAATAHAAVWNGCVPVFADCEEGTYNLDPDQIESLITDRTSAIMPVYTFGLPPRLDALKEIARKHGLKMICDAAQGLGSLYKGGWGGSFGDAEVFSLSPTKVVSAIEGGLVTTDNDEIARRLRTLRKYGQADDGCDMEYVGLSARFSEINAVIGLRNFERLEQLVEKRLELMKRYRAHLQDVSGISFQHQPAECRTTGNYFVIFVSQDTAAISRDKLYEGLLSNGIQTKKYFYPPVHKQTAYRSYQTSGRAPLPVTERAANQALALPLYTHMDPADIDFVCDQVKKLIS